jgi:hypothetical protein
MLFWSAPSKAIVIGKRLVIAMCGSSLKDFKKDKYNKAF